MKKAEQRFTDVNEEVYELVQSLILAWLLIQGCKESSCPPKSIYVSQYLIHGTKKYWSLSYLFLEGDVSFYKAQIVDQVRDLKEECLEVKGPARRSDMQPSTFREGKIVTVVSQPTSS